MSPKPTDNRPENGPTDDSYNGHLAGQTVLVTRSRDQSASLCQQLESLGAQTLVHPVIEIDPSISGAEVDAAITDLERFDWLVFVSGNGVRFFLERLKQVKGSLDALDSLRIAAIGTGTENQLRELTGLNASLTPKRSNSDGLADALISVVDGQRLLIIRADRGSQVLANRLADANMEFEQISVYRSIDVQQADSEVVELMRQGQIDWVTMTSSAIARSAIRLFGPDLANTKTASISPATSAAMKELGVCADAEASQYDLTGLVEAICNWQP